MRRSLVLAVFCAAAPLVAGVAVFAAWVYTRAAWLPTAGMAVMGVGVVLFLIGGWALLRYLRSGRPNMLAVLLVGGLLIGNFPVAGLLTGAVMMIESAYIVEVHNQTGQALTDARVTGGGCIEVLGAMAPGDTEKRVFRVRTDGKLVFTAREGNTERSKIIDGYVTNGQGGHTTVTILPEGAVMVVNRAP